MTTTTREPAKYRASDEIYTGTEETCEGFSTWSTKTSNTKLTKKINSSLVVFSWLFDVHCHLLLLTPSQSSPTLGHCTGF